MSETNINLKDSETILKFTNQISKCIDLHCSLLELFYSGKIKYIDIPQIDVNFLFQIESILNWILGDSSSTNQSQVMQLKMRLSDFTATAQNILDLKKDNTKPHD